MTVAEVREKCKRIISRVPRDAVVVAVLVLSSSLSFGLGYLAGQGSGQGSSLVLEESPLATSSTRSSIVENSKVVASKNGTKFYLPNCAGADRISDANKVWFASATAAIKAGYTPSANCKGI